jgi:hypothetical protein
VGPTASLVPRQKKGAGIWVAVGEVLFEYSLECGRPEFHWYPTHFRKKRGNGWGTEVYRKREIALARRADLFCAERRLLVAKTMIGNTINKGSSADKV